jgi:hypothetical protein
MVQTSLFITQVWRGNVNVKPLLYQSDPSHPDPEDIVTCRDYLVGYQMIGAQTLTIEGGGLVMNVEDIYGNTEAVFSASRKLLSLASVDTTISKQEDMYLLAQLLLILCSDRIEPVSLSPSRCIYNQIEAKKYKTMENTMWVMEYQRRTAYSTICFHHYMTGEMNLKKGHQKK